jgi:glutamyl-tRNA synthetase
MAIRVRFAPSPTGYLHVGGARTALFNWLFARRNRGTFVLRIEDTDASRNTREALEAIYDGLKWLGIDWDEGPGIGGAFGPYLQSERTAIYTRRLETLLASGHAYHDAGAVRLRSPKQRITVQDCVAGEITIDRSQENDTVLRRSDGSFIFHFVNVVDDIEMAVTHVIRGEDHIMNTPKHIEIFEALGAPVPSFAHLPLILNMNGSKMSKRDQGSAVDWYQKQGFLPEAVRNFLCLLGWSPKDDRQKLPIGEVIDRFDWDHLNRAPAKFDLDKCLWLNGQYLAELLEDEYVAAYDRFVAYKAEAAHTMAPGSIPNERAALKLVRPRVSTLEQARMEMTRLFATDSSIDPAAVEKLRTLPDAAKLCSMLPGTVGSATPWSEEGVRGATSGVANELGVKQKTLMMPLRILATGSLHGPDLVPAMVLRPQAEVAEVMRARLAHVFPELQELKSASEKEP